MNERVFLDLMIARLPELSCREKLLLSETPGAELDLIRKSKSDIEYIIKRQLPSFWDAAAIQKMAEHDAKTAELRGIGILSVHDGEYPPLLREIYDPPLLLFYKGRLPNPEKPLAAIVGTRKPGPGALAQTYEIARDLGRSGISVVSGLALGIDAMAHRGNCEGGGFTVAVLGSGLDEVYPSSNRPLARRILDTGGALFSEYPPGTGPRKWNFPARNRIISGLARGVLIAQAPQKSGALITAGFALEQNRELWVMSAGVADNGDTEKFDCRGTMKLAEDGAGIIRCSGDILQAWNISGQPDTEEQRTDGETYTANKSTGNHLAGALAESLGISL